MRRPGNGHFSWPPLVLPGAPLRKRASQAPDDHERAAPVREQAQGLSRYLAHGLVLGLVAIVAIAGNIGLTTGEAHPFALDHAAELPSAFAHPDDRNAGDTLLKPPAPITQLVNRPRQGITMYRVEEGDTVADIAEKHEISVPTVLWANNMTEDELLTPARQLIILPVSGVLHTVQAGEKIEDIARQYGSDSQAIIDFNLITDPDRIIPNEVLVVPGGRKLERPRPLPSARSEMRPGADDTVTEGALSASSTAASAAAPRVAQQASSYTVARGDSLSTIAAKFGISTETLMWANGLQDNPELISEGKTLTILPVTGALHTVSEGDTLLAIAARYGASVDQIVQTNALASVDSLKIGQKLIVPGAQLATAADIAAKAQAATPSLKYSVVSGDSLNSIAYRFGVDPSSITRASGLSSGDYLSIGQELVIPGGQAPTAPAAPAPKPASSAPAPASPPPPPPASSGSGGSQIVNIASKYLGYAYSWGGSSPSTGFDCSGFVSYVYRQAGVSLPTHDLWGQLQAGPRISQGNLQPGDIVFFQNTYQSGLSHDGIYIGGGRFINAEDYGKGVRVASLNDSYWASRFFGASRPW